MNFFKILVVIILCAVSSAYSQPQKIILDTDFDSDVDDAGALAMLHTLADNGVVDILGIIVTSSDKHAPLAVDAVNTYFDRPNIPVGVQKGIEFRERSKYTKEISEEYNHSLKNYEKAERATKLYRRLLSSHSDSSVVIIPIGHLSNLQELIESKPDEHSKLSGIDLIRKKVKFWSCMGGKFPEGKEANFSTNDPASTNIVIEKWPSNVEVEFAGWEIGDDVITGSKYLKKALSSESPVWRAYQLYNNFQGRASWDQVAILNAVLPEKNDYWDVNHRGYVKVDKDGSNKWVQRKNTNQSHLVEKMDPHEIAKIFDALMTGVYRKKFINN